MYARLEEAQDIDDPDLTARTYYTDIFPVSRLEEIVKESLARRSTNVATESMKQKFLQSLGTLRRKASENVRYTPIVNNFLIVNTKDRQSNSVSAAELRSTKTIYFTDQSRGSLVDEQIEFFDEATEPGSYYKCVPISNRYDYKVPLNLVIADSENERYFIRELLQPEIISHYDMWLKSTSIGFYKIDYAWKKGEHPKRGEFSPDFFIKAGDLIVVVEIKDDDEIRDPSDENKKKFEYAAKHFERVNSHLESEGNAIRYVLTFLTQRNYNRFFQSLKEGNIASFRSELDVKLSED